MIRLGSTSPHTLHALLAYVSRARFLHEFYFFAVTSVTRWGKWGKSASTKLGEKEEKRNVKMPRNSWIEGCLLKLVLIVLLFLETERVVWCVVTLVTVKKQKLLLCVRARERKP